MPKKTNLSEYSKLENQDTSTWKVAIVTADWNPKITHSLRDACIETLTNEGLDTANILSVAVPGAFEIPAAAKILLKHDPELDAVIGLGCVIKGETSHNEYINNAVANGLTQLSLLSNKPCIFGVLTPNTEEQALDRAGGKHGNKGIEAASTALQMIALQKGLKTKLTSIGF